jgi:hypothetical protein
MTTLWPVALQHRLTVMPLRGHCRNVGRGVGLQNRPHAENSMSCGGLALANQVHIPDSDKCPWNLQKCQKRARLICPYAVHK